MDKDYVCEARSDIKDWNQVRVTAALSDLDGLTAVMSMIDANLMIEDYSDIDLKTCYGDLIDESILAADKSIASVSVFLPMEKSYIDAIAFIRERCAAEKIDIRIEVIGVNEEDWANSWKAYYKPIRIGKRMVIVPAWESYEESSDDIVVRMDPGMAFGTGTHETTKLVIELLEKYTKPGCRMLDVGCGSGILAICTAKLGARECKAYDIDPVAVRVARENIEASGLPGVTCDVSDLLREVDTTGGAYDLITANIVADIIIRMSPDIGRYMHEDTVLLTSGIIAERSADVKEALLGRGLTLVEEITENGWCALAFRKAQ